MNDPSRGYRTSSDPDLDPIRQLDPSRKLDVVAEDDLAERVGWALLSGWMLDGPLPIATYSLMIGGDKLDGLFMRVGSRFSLIVA
jgi:hypothetical protein